MLWQLQRGYYARESTRAWSDSGLPQRITCNPVIALAYARVVLGFLRDWHAALVPGEPVYIVELGAGAGRFGYLFLAEFQELLQRSPLRDLVYTYVMTDFVEETVDFWQAHSQLQPFVTAGQLDFARFDLEQPHDLTLRHAGVALGAARLRNPLVVLANYVFDSVPQDAFAVRAGRLHESLVTVSLPEGETDLAAPEALARLQVSFAERPVTPDYYAREDWDRILARYEQRLGDTHFVFPRAALQCMDGFRQLCGDRLLLLTGDKAYSREEELVEREEPDLAWHAGCFSLSVNHHAIGQYFLDRGGQFLATGFRPFVLDVSAFLLGRPPGDYLEARLAFDATLQRRHPADVTALKLGLEPHYTGLDLEQLLAWLRLSNWDPNLFCNVFTVLMDRLSDAPRHLHVELYRAIRELGRRYYYAGEAEDVPFFLAMLLCQMGHYPDALQHLRRSQELHGEDAATSYNMALCHYQMRQFAKALQCLDRTLALDPQFESAEEMRQTIRSLGDR
jgi:tetratricopeptide (TPR) repeat protein